MISIKTAVKYKNYKLNWINIIWIIIIVINNNLSSSFPDILNTCVIFIAMLATTVAGILEQNNHFQIEINKEFPKILVSTRTFI